VIRYDKASRCRVEFVSNDPAVFCGARCSGMSFQESFLISK
jgi:hypothetical protein